MSTERILVIALGTAAMLAVMLLRRTQFPDIALWKIPVICVLLAVCGVLGALGLFYVENGRFGGTSFFGAVLAVPVLMAPVGWVLRIKWSRLMDLCGPSECAMLCVMKIDCIRHGCCAGRMLGSIRFPSQAVEMAAAAVILLWLMKLEKQGQRKNLYGWYLLLYGASRFVLNWLRETNGTFFWLLPPGNFWALICTALGILWILSVRKRETI